MNALQSMRQLITKLIIPMSDLGLREQTFEPLTFPDDLPPVLAVMGGQTVGAPRLAQLGTNGGFLMATGNHGATLNTGQLAVTTTAAAVIGSNTNRYSVVLTNTGTTTVYLGGSGVTTGTGHALPSGQSIALQSSASIYAIAAAGGNTVTYCEEAV